MSLVTHGRRFLGRGAAGAAAGGAVTPFFSDSFASGQLNPANGFTYTPLGAFGSLSTDQAHSGTHSVKITYGPNAADTYGNQGGGVELRFNMGRYVSELWIEHWLYLPSNYTHKRNSIASGLSSNNKHLLLWRDPAEYSTTSFLAVQEMEYDYGGFNPGGSASRLYATERLAAVPAATKDFSNGVPGLGGTNGPVLTGQWNKLQTHWKPSSAAGVLDGVYQWWVNVPLNQQFHDSGSIKYY